MSDPYDPRGALTVVQDAIRRNTPVIHGEDGRPMGGGLVDEEGNAYAPQVRPETVCFLLVQWCAGLAVIPDDFHNVPKTAGGLREHVRPDGGVYLGLFETPADPAGAVVVYGDPLMDIKDAMRRSLQYRAKVLAQLDTFDRHHALGPFAAATTGPTSDLNQETVS